MELHPLSLFITGLMDSNVVKLILVDLHERHPCTAMTEGNSSALQLMIETDKRLTYHQIRISLGVGMIDIGILTHLFDSPDLLPCQRKNFEESGLRTPRKQWLHMETPSKRPLNSSRQTLSLARVTRGRPRLKLFTEGVFLTRPATNVGNSVHTYSANRANISIHYSNLIQIGSAIVRREHRQVEKHLLTFL
ncbi:hypothetical protein EVAR_76999_1 [Eumeta japonica]|uniref:Uncharacterized protein n=1 Tax=Eumeta variegata TaxID=151549 RepID=A0A4C1SFX7_EUMVA|nr:hypothetical protein EVAR_76999_1 [Eumeta japonica]